MNNSLRNIFIKVIIIIKAYIINIYAKNRLNGWVFVYELSGCGFESSCSHFNWFILKYFVSFYIKSKVF